MTSLRFIIASLRHYRRVHVSVALGVAVATAVLTGALLVGDSVTGSLRDLTLQRLGRIDSALVAGHLFREALADEVSSDPGFKKYFDAAEPVILMTGTLQAGAGNEVRRATKISVIGCRSDFWLLGQGGPRDELTGDEVAITQSIARELAVKTGDEILLRLPLVNAIPADSPLGEKSDTSAARRLKVAAILPDEGLARFGLLPTQHEPRNAFVSLTTLQSMLEKSGTANTILIAAARAPAAASNEAGQTALKDALHPRLDDFGIRIEQLAAPVPHTNISSDTLVLSDKVVQTAERVLKNDSPQSVSTYLANTIELGEGDSKRKIPYSTIAGVNSLPGIGPLLDNAGQPIQLADHEIVLNDWAANDLQAKVGDTITITFYDPESTHGELRVRTPAPKFTLKAIVPLTKSDGQPAAAADPKLTPEMPGVTDQKSIRDWDLPFELVETIRQQDEDYWDKCSTTPKAFVSLAAAERLWPSRWGVISLIRLPVAESLRDSDETKASSPNETSQQLETQIRDRLSSALDPADVGMTFLPVRRMGLAAASGTTPFGMLFLGFSFFLIAAALMLIALLFQLGVSERARELGTLEAVGVDRRRITRLLSREGLVVAVTGAAIGVLGGIVYAWLMVLGLRTWWLDAIATPFLELHISWTSILIGCLSGILLSWLTIRFAIRRLVRRSVVRLLSGSADEPMAVGDKNSRGTIWPKVRIALLLMISALVAVGFNLQGEAQAGAFFGSGAAALALMLGEVRRWLRNAGRAAAALGPLSLPKLSRLNAARNAGRSTLTIGLVASASFLIIAISAFRLETTDAGTGRFEYIATSDRPIHFNLNTDEGRIELGLDGAGELLDTFNVYSLRLASGEDASCLNLYRPTQPRVLGVPNDFIARGGFAWAATDDSAPKNPWEALNHNLGGDEHGEPVVPVVIDAATAIYSLHLKGAGSRLTIRDSADHATTVQVVGLLKNSILQGSLLMSESNFLRLFPDIGGYRFFLMEHKSKDSEAGSQMLPKVLESALANEGFDVVDARAQLAAYLAVQNTYLSTFQSLGALGLLLGTIGLAVVQLRSVLERRGELALLRAGGFSRRRVMQMVIVENALLLIGGLIIGALAAAIALVPQWAPQSANVPWLTLASLLAAIAVTGLVAGWLATRSVLRAPILPALRGD
jgi:ABC-type antimicrobial peptide transport system permease subunit